ncbi:MAG: ATP-binding protein [Candidatus Micrarchaeota archaeon]
MENKFDLNIEKVLENWTVADGIREVISNAMDEQILSNTKEIDIFENKDGWHIRDYGRGVHYKHLTQNENQEKLNNPEKVIGKFGVGLKDAFATFDRYGIQIKIISRHGSITTQKFEKHGFKDVKTLHAIIDESSADKNFQGTEIILKGCSKKDMDAAKSNFLKFSQSKILEKTKLGEIYEKTDKQAIIYITGLKVATEENYLFSYNITSMTAKLRKALNRERSNVGRTAYSDRIMEILLQSQTKPVAEQLVKDLQQFGAGEMHDEVSRVEVSVHACKLLNSFEKVVFATSFELIEKKELIDQAKKDGYKVIVIPDNVKEKIQGVKDIQGNPMIDLGQYVQNFNESFEFKFIDEKQLNQKEQEIFSKTKQLLDLIGGKPASVKKILITETMRLEANGFQPAGLWDYPNIIIQRDQLKDLQTYAGVLLHEATHATSGTSDVSREFEDALTEIIGKIALQTLEM